MKKYLKKHIGVLTTAVILSAIAWGMMAVTAIFSQVLVDDIVSGNTESFINNLIIAGFFAVSMGIIYFVSGLFREKFSAAIDKSMRDDVYNGVMRRSRTDFESKDTAAYISNVSNDTGNVTSVLSMISGYLFGALVSSAVALVIMLTYSILLTVIAVAASLLAMVVPVFFSKPLAKRQMEISEVNEQFTSEMKEIFEGRDVIASLNLFKGFGKRFGRKNTEVARAKYKRGRLNEGSQSIIHMSGFITNIVMILATGFMVMNGSATIGVLVLFTHLSGTFGGGIGMLMQLWPFMQSIKPVMAKITAITDYDDKSFTGSTPPAFNEKLEIKNLDFRYNEEMPVINQMNLTIRKNEKIALIGPSGCGKTTLMKLLSGEYAGYSGEIMYDGVDLKDIAVAELYKLITIIQQNIYIFNESIRFNICLDEDFSDADLERALRLSGVEKFLPDVPGGIDGSCGEKGQNLSGGQRQRIAIARAIIRGVKFIVLDEGVSAIDVETANEIERELLNMDDLTLVSITHRIKDGLTESYDRIINMADAVKGELATHNPEIIKQEKEKEVQPMMKMIQISDPAELKKILAELEKEHGGEIKMMSASSPEEAEKLIAEMTKVS